jgi:hypothetical protein
MQKEECRMKEPERACMPDCNLVRLGATDIVGEDVVRTQRRAILGVATAEAKSGKRQNFLGGIRWDSLGCGLESGVCEDGFDLETGEGSRSKNAEGRPETSGAKAEFGIRCGVFFLTWQAIVPFMFIPLLLGWF